MNLEDFCSFVNSEIFAISLAGVNFLVLVTEVLPDYAFPANTSAFSIFSRFITSFPPRPK
jgi:hypothetical protein